MRRPLVTIVAKRRTQATIQSEEVLLVKGATIVLALWGLAALDPDQPVRQPGGLGYIVDAFRVGVSVVGEQRHGLFEMLLEAEEFSFVAAAVGMESLYFSAIGVEYVVGCAGKLEPERLNAARRIAANPIG